MIYHYIFEHQHFIVLSSCAADLHVHALPCFQILVLPAEGFALWVSELAELLVCAAGGKLKLLLFFIASVSFWPQLSPSLTHYKDQLSAQASVNDLVLSYSFIESILQAGTVSRSCLVAEKRYKLWDHHTVSSVPLTGDWIAWTVRDTLCL